MPRLRTKSISGNMFGRSSKHDPYDLKPWRSFSVNRKLKPKIVGRDATQIASNMVTQQPRTNFPDFMGVTGGHDPKRLTSTRSMRDLPAARDNFNGYTDRLQQDMDDHFPDSHTTAPFDMDDSRSLGDAASISRSSEYLPGTNIPGTNVPRRHRRTRSGGFHFGSKNSPAKAQKMHLRQPRELRNSQEFDYGLTGSRPSSASGSMRRVHYPPSPDLKKTDYYDPTNNGGKITGALPSTGNQSL
ncbi:hypothetical protein Ciccas_004553 [Cichlidogyrus casuarinus]|uniref:Uncharacterized protein n=1 Tax=Cichlidogyrus casuarinus TaxID=1844966 RepID=A0ABD2QBA5_9PLAT